MDTAYVALYTWDWAPIGQATLDLRPLYRNGVIDRSELDDATKKAAEPLLKGLSVRDVHVFVYGGEKPVPLEQLLESAREEYSKRGPDAESWDRNRRIKRPEPIRPDSLGGTEIK